MNDVHSIDILTHREKRKMETFNQNVKIPNFNSQNTIITQDDIHLKMDFERKIDNEVMQSEIEEYFDIICSHMKQVFGNESLEIEGLERILKVAKIYSDDFKDFIQND